MKFSRFVIFSFSLYLILFGFFSIEAHASTNIVLRDQLGDQFWVYKYLEKLKSGGLIKVSILNTRPLTREYIGHLIMEARENYLKIGEMEEFWENILKKLEVEFETEINFFKGLKETASLLPYQNYFKIDRWENSLYYLSRVNSLENNSGDWFNQGVAYRKDLFFRGNFNGNFDFYLHPRLKINSQNDSASFSPYYHPLGPATAPILFIPQQDRFGVELSEAYGKYTFKNIELEIGRDSLWWGPGYHGSLMLSNQAPPFDMVKISNPIPFRLPFFLKYIGEIKIDWFLTQLEKDRPIANPYLNGTRIAFSPFSFLTIGASRMIQFGGQGMVPLTSKNYYKILFISKRTTEKEPQFENNQLASIDVSLQLTNLRRWLPLSQGLKLYYELAGDDQATKLANNPVGGGGMAGLYFNGLFLVNSLDLRIEYVRNHEGDREDVHDLWYNHGAYTPGYTYQGRIIGHHMGTDADDLFFRLSKDFSPFELAWEFDRERHRIWDPNREYKYEAGMQVVYRYSKQANFNAKFEYGLINNNNFVNGNTLRYNSSLMGVEYNF